MVFNPVPIKLFWRTPVVTQANNQTLLFLALPYYTVHLSCAVLCCICVSISSLFIAWWVDLSLTYFLYLCVCFFECLLIVVLSTSYQCIHMSAVFASFEMWPPTPLEKISNMFICFYFLFFYFFNLEKLLWRFFRNCHFLGTSALGLVPKYWHSDIFLKFPEATLDLVSDLKTESETK